MNELNINQIKAENINEALYTKNGELFKKIIDSPTKITYLQPNILQKIPDDKLEIQGIKFNFSDTKWDFFSAVPEYKHNYLKRADRVIDFSELEKTYDYYRDLAAFWVLNNLLHYGVQKPSIYLKYTNISKFLIYLYKRGVYELEYISLDDVTEYLDAFKDHPQAKIKHKICIKDVYLFYCSVVNVLPKENIIRYLSINNDSQLAENSLESKLPLLKHKFVIEFVKILKEIRDNSQEDIQNRIKSCLLIILTQTGIRPSELVSLPFDCLREGRVEGMPYAHLIYIVCKQRNTKIIYNRTIANEDTCQSIKTIQALQPGTKLLGNVKLDALRLWLNRLIFKYRYRLECCTKDPDMSFSTNRYYKQKLDNENHYLNIPSLKQFRVYFATELSRRGYNSYVISALLGHTSTDLIDYYVRPVSEKEEDKIYRDIFLSDIIEDDLKIIGPRGDEYTQRIKNFLKSKA